MIQYSVHIHCGIIFILGLHIRLVGGSSSHRGRVEVSVDGSHWGTVCDDSFDYNNNGARVVCRMLGYPMYVIERYFLLLYSDIFTISSLKKIL